MSERKKRGCIYWDESSRGCHNNPGRTPYHRGRWVGERTENGRRVRMRSSDYEKVLAWVTAEKDYTGKGIPLIGFPSYFVNIEKQEVYSKSRILKGYLRAKRTMYCLCSESGRICTSFNRLAYAAIHSIDVRQIPSDIIVSFKNGEYILQYFSDRVHDDKKELQRERRKVIEKTLDKRKCEIEILQRYYETLDSSELITYVTKQSFDHLVFVVMKKKSLQLCHAIDVVIEATESFLRRVIDSDIPVVSITTNILMLCYTNIKNRKQKIEYNDNIRYKRL